MTRNEIILGIDVGTTATKVAAFGPRGKLLAVKAIAYPLLQPLPGRAEQDPERILAACIAGVQLVLAETGSSGNEVSAIGFSTAMHSLIALDADGGLLTPVITWADDRAASQARRIRNAPSGLALYQRTGTPIHAMSPLCKLVWLREECPEVFAAAARFVSLKSYVVGRLFGRWVEDHAVASASGLFNLAALDWDVEALAIADVRPSQLPELVPTTHILTGMEPEIAARMGLPRDVPFVIGASDGVLANLGVGAVGPGELAVTLGTSGAVRQTVPSPITDPHGRTFCFALAPDNWVVGGASNAGGLVLAWLRDQLVAGVGPPSIDELLTEAASAPVGAAGLLCLPYLAGERAPIWNADARGVFFGLGLHHGRPHLVRAALEGVLLNLGSIARALTELVGPARQVRISGGLARSALCRQTLADVLGVPVVVPETVDASALGAAILARHALEPRLELAEACTWIALPTRHEPDPGAHARYQELAELAKRVYDALEPVFPSIVALQTSSIRAGDVVRHPHQSAPARGQAPAVDRGRRPNL